MQCKWILAIAFQSHPHRGAFSMNYSAGGDDAKRRSLQEHLTNNYSTKQTGFTGLVSHDQGIKGLKSADR